MVITLLQYIVHVLKYIMHMILLKLFKFGSVWFLKHNMLMNSKFYFTLNTLFSCVDLLDFVSIISCAVCFREIVTY